MDINVDKICRSCTKESKELRSIYKKGKICGEITKLADMLSYFTNLEYKENDGLPSQMCTRCMLQVGKAYTFKQKCIQAEEILQKQFGKLLEDQEIIFEIDEDMMKDNYSDDNEDDNAKTNDNQDDNTKRNDDDDHDNTKRSDDSDTDKPTKTINVPKTVENAKQEIILSRTIMEDSCDDEQEKENDGNSEDDDDDDDNVTIYIKQDVNGKTSYFTKENIDKMPKTLQNKLNDSSDISSADNKSITSNDNDYNNVESDPEIEVKEELINDEVDDENSVYVNDDSEMENLFVDPIYVDGEPQNNLTNDIDKMPKLILKRRQRIESARSKNQSPYSCEECGKVLRNFSSYKYHIKLHSDKTPYLCNYCGEKFKTPNAYQGHMVTHKEYNPHTCLKCNKSYRQAASLRSHLLTHSGVKPFICNVCGKGSTQKSGHKKHMLTHTGERPYQCDVCNKFFRYSSNLIMHKRSHNGEKPYECDICKKKFIGSEQLKRHLIIHTGEKPYKCSICGKCFNRNGTLQIHLRIHAGEKRASCTVCNKSFYEFQLVSHMESHEDVEEIL